MRTFIKTDGDQIVGGIAEVMVINGHPISTSIMMNNEDMEVPEALIVLHLAHVRLLLWLVSYTITRRVGYKVVHKMVHSTTVSGT